MRILGLPLWAIVVVACALAPFVIRAWIDAEERRAKGRTASLLASLGMRVGSTRKRGGANVDAGGAASAEADDDAGDEAGDEAGSPIAASTRRSDTEPGESSGDGKDSA
jgi:hypothetical protein